MGSKEEYLDWVMELLEPMGNFTSKAMFGGFGIFDSGVMFALVPKATGLYFKVDDSNRQQYEDAGSKRFIPMPYYEVPPDILEDQDSLKVWAAKSIAIAHATSKK